MSQSEIQERAARLNTQLRFGKRKEALREAYRLRTFIQLCGYQNEETQRELQRVEKVISELEVQQVSGIQKLVDVIVRTVNRSLNPEDDSDHETLLDRFKERAEKSGEPQQTHPETGDSPLEELLPESSAKETSKKEAWLGAETDEYY